MNNRKPLWFRAAAILLSLTVALGLDYGVRQIYLKITYRPLVYKHPHRVPHRVPHPVYHHGIEPKRESEEAIGKYAAPFFSNSLGMKDSKVREVPLKGDRPRVLLMGDSFTEGIGTAWDKTFAGILANRLEVEGVDFISLYPAFLDRGSAAEVIGRYYWENDCHWNEEGQRLVAETLFNQHRAALMPLSLRPGQGRH